jgi:inner membrane protease subunit 1
MASATACATVVVAAWTFLRAKPSRIGIEGPSMAPTLLPGDWALVVPRRAYGRGDVVVVEHPGRPGYEMAKRITGVPGDTVGERRLRDDEYWIEGDFAQASTDSPQDGPVTIGALKAKVLLVYWPSGRRHIVR